MHVYLTPLTSVNDNAMISTSQPSIFFFFFLNDPAPPEISTLSLHDALPICAHRVDGGRDRSPVDGRRRGRLRPQAARARAVRRPRQGRAATRRRVTASAVSVLIVDDDPVSDRKSTRLNSSHLVISYAVFCLK